MTHRQQELLVKCACRQIVAITKAARTLGVPPDTLLQYQLIKSAQKGRALALAGKALSRAGAGALELLKTVGTGAAGFFGGMLGAKSVAYGVGDTFRNLAILLSVGVPTASALLLAYLLTRNRAKDQAEIRQMLINELAEESRRRGRLELAQTMSAQEKAQARKKKKMRAPIESTGTTVSQPQPEDEYMPTAESNGRPASLTPANELLWR